MSPTPPVAPCTVTKRSSNAPQPQPMSSTRPPRTWSSVAKKSSLRFCATSSSSRRSSSSHSAHDVDVHRVPATAQKNRAAGHSAWQWRRKGAGSAKRCGVDHGVPCADGDRRRSRGRRRSPALLGVVELSKEIDREVLAKPDLDFDQNLRRSERIDAQVGKRCVGMEARGLDATDLADGILHQELGLSHRSPRLLRSVVLL